MSSVTSASSRARPTNAVATVGRFVCPTAVSGGEGGGLLAPPRRRGGKVGGADWKDPPGLAEPLDRVLARVARARREEPSRRAREEPLPAVARRGDARRPVHVEPDIALRG